MKKIGLWINNEKAVIVITSSTKVNVHKVLDKNRPNTKIIEAPSNRSVCSRKSGKNDIYLFPQGKYFEHLINYLSGAKHILIAGPDDTSEFFYKHLRINNKNICDSVCNVKHMEHMPDAKIANYFITYFSQYK